jgi:SAM-dependent methyltransferase
VCHSARLEPAGLVHGHLSGRAFHLASCLDCRFSFVIDPWTAFDQIYSEAYYHGRGADPSVDYVFELEHPETTVRRYEWEGLLRAIGALVPIGPETRWLDFGCGNGGLVRWARDRGIAHAVGHETGWMAERASADGIPLISVEQVANCHGAFDVVTAVEVLEHVPDPVEVLKLLARVLKPGGLLFLTTGNARPFRGRLPHWRYVMPEVHVSFFEPETLDRAMKVAGFQPTYRGFVDGFDQVIRFKILKTLGVRRRAMWERMVPWGLVARAVDSRLSVTAHPVGFRIATEAE